MQKVARRMIGDLKETMFSRWADNVYEIRRQRSIISRISSRMKNRNKLGSFNRWLEFVEERYDQRRLVGKVFNRLMKGKIVAGWQTWLDYIDNQKERKIKFKINEKNLIGQTLNIEFRNINPISPLELFISPDSRKLGFLLLRFNLLNGDV